MVIIIVSADTCYGWSTALGGESEGQKNHGKSLLVSRVLRPSRGSKTLPQGAASGRNKAERVEEGEISADCHLCRWVFPVEVKEGRSRRRWEGMLEVARRTQGRAEWTQMQLRNLHAEGAWG